MKIIDLFCGIGGLSLGFEQAGYEVVAAIDNWADAIRTYNHNRKDKVAHTMSVEDFNRDVVKSLLKNQKIDGVIGGPPCQGFSTVGKRDTDDPRNKLYLDFYECVKLVKPKFFVIENVKGMLTLNKGAFVKDLVERFGENGLGYHITYKLVNAANYGVPQNRERVFYVGLKKVYYEFPQPFSYMLSAKDGISDLARTEDGSYATEPQNDFQKRMRGDMVKPVNHDFTSHTDQTISIISQVPDGGGIKDLPPDYWSVRKYNKAFERMSSQRPSNTIDTGHRNYFHYIENRIPTVREAARIQSFPDNFEVLGTRGSQYKQVGNAVPPLLAKAIAEQIKNFIKR